MRAAILSELGVPRPGDFREPEPAAGQAVVEVLAAGLNPVDVSISAGTFYAGPPQLPCVAGREGVGRIAGERVYFDAPIAPFGSMAERSLVDPATTYPVPDGVGDGAAVAIGIAGLAAWLALTWRARLEPGEHVLVLGASGVVGQIAVQAARVLGAGRVVAAARSPEGLALALGLGADAAVSLSEPDLPGAFSRAAEGRIDVVVDPLFGAPLTAAMQAASFCARIVQLGQSAGAEATISSPVVRGKLLALMGHSNFAAPLQVRRDGYRQMGEALARGEIRVDVLELALDRVADAWAMLAAGSHGKIVLLP